MNLIYSISKGAFFTREEGEKRERIPGECWSGCGTRYNKPGEYKQKDAPIPPGIYVMLSPILSEHGPYSIELKPDKKNNMYKRSNFWIISPSRVQEKKGHESETGNIVAFRQTREALVATGIFTLHVEE